MPLNKVQRLFGRHAINRAGPVMERNTVALVRNHNDLGTESGANKLCVLRLRDGVQKSSYGGTVLGVEIGVDFVKNDKGTGLGRLQGENEAKSAKTCGEKTPC